jgi:hypothetical protein
MDTFYDRQLFEDFGAKTEHLGRFGNKNPIRIEYWNG